MSPAHRLALCVGLVVATTTLAGCLGDPQGNDASNESAEADGPPRTETEREHQATRVPRMEPDTPATYTTDDWFLLSTPRHPDGHIRAFHFRIPDGAVATVGDREGGLPLVFLEIVPVHQDLEPDEDWALYGFRDHGGSAQVMFAIYGVTMHVENLSRDPPTDEVRGPNRPGQVYIVAGEDLADADDLYFVLVGHGDDGEMALAMRIRFGEDRTAPVAAPTFAAFADSVTGTPMTPTPIHDTTGAYKAVFGETINSDGPRLRAATANVVYDQEPIAGTPNAGEPTARRLTVATDAPTGEGWTYATIQHDAGSEVIAWSLEIAAQGMSGRANGVTGGVPVPGLSELPDAASGRPSAFYLADGTGTSHTRLTLEGATGDFGVFTYVHHGWLSAPLAHIIGIPSDQFGEIHQGAAGGLPWLGDLPPS